MTRLLALLALLALVSPADGKALRERIVFGPPNPARLIEGIGPVEAFLIGIPFCMAVKPIISSAIKGRELTLKEAYEAVAGCLLPFVGGWIVRRTFPERWNNLPMRRWERDFGIGAVS